MVEKIDFFWNILYLVPGQEIQTHIAGYRIAQALQVGKGDYNIAQRLHTNGQYPPRRFPFCPRFTGNIHGE
jgi:hypothetical protein